MVTSLIKYAAYFCLSGEASLEIFTLNINQNCES